MRLSPVWRSCVGLILSLTATASAAPPTITSSPSTKAGAHERYRYDGDGRAEATGTGPLSWSLTASPPGMDVDNLTGEVFWLPDTPGNFAVELRVRNAEGEARQTYILEVTGEVAPAIQPVQTDSVELGEPVQLTFAATGAQPLYWEKVSGPSNALVNPMTGELAWVPGATGPVTLVVSAINPVGQATYTWTVNVVSVALPAPTALFTILNPQGEPPLFPVMEGTVSSSNHPGSPYLDYAWDFGDGSPTKRGFVPLVAHSYVLPGVYPVTMTVTNLYNQSSTITQNVVVTTSGRTPPSVVIKADVPQGSAPVSVAFDCDCRQGDAAIVSYEWDFGDGEGSRQAKPTHVYATAAGYNVKLTVTDADGLEGRATFFLPVKRGLLIPPFARARATPRAGDAPLEVRFVPEFGDQDGLVSSVRWEFPNGVVATGEPTRTYGSLGTYPARLIVVDNDGLESRDTIEIRVTRNGMVPPAVVSVPSTSARAGQPYLYDEDGRAAARGSLPLTWQVGKRVGGETVDAPEGMTVDEATGLLRWTPTEAQVGEVRVSLLVSNGAGVAVQDFVVTVEGSQSAPPGGCGCGGAPPGPLAFSALLVLASCARRFGRRS